MGLTGVDSNRGCGGVEQAAGSATSVRQVDQSAALDAVRKLESRLRAAEDEVSEFRLKVCVSGFDNL